LGGLRLAQVFRPAQSSIILKAFLPMDSHLVNHVRAGEGF
jgi:hypothetical protein